MCLVPGLWRGLLGVRRLLLAFTVGASLAAVYAIWQWPAQRFGLPLADVLTTRDSSGLTEGGNQGPGLLGWERARGTFLEPHFLGGFMSAAAPLAIVAAAQARGAARPLAAAGAAAMCGALIVSSSAPAFAGFGIAAVLAGTAWAIGSGRPALAAAAAAATAVAVLAAPVLVAAPEVLAAATGRDATTLTATADFRKQTWNRVLDIWAAQPAGGYGAGQSSVQLSLVTQGPDAVALNSAQGLWASSLLDVGLVGLGFWIALLGAGVVFVLRSVASGSSLPRVMLLMAMVAALCSTLVAGDRLDLRLWLLLGIVAAASLRPAIATSKP
jgi:O-antigen ligase